MVMSGGVFSVHVLRVDHACEGAAISARVILADAFCMLHCVAHPVRASERAPSAAVCLDIYRATVGKFLQPCALAGGQVAQVFSNRVSEWSLNR